MNGLVIGNGFDLTHGLPTRYREFLKFCYICVLSKLIIFTKLVSILNYI